jgi:hypothetical protein
MKKLFALAVIFALVLAGCDDGNGNNNGDGSGETTLTVKNLSDYGKLNITYGSIEFYGIGRGENSTKTVSTGTRYVNIIYDLPSYGDCLFVTNEAITCEEGKNTQFTITNDTIISIWNGYDGMRNTTGSLKSVIQDLLNWAESNR